MRGRVINIHHKEKYTTYIGRAGKGQNGYFGSRIPLGKPCPICGKKHTRQDFHPCYKRDLWSRMKDPEFCHLLRELEGETLGCFCVPKGGYKEGTPYPCHGFIMLDAIDYMARTETDQDKFERIKRLKVLLAGYELSYSLKRNADKAFELEVLIAKLKEKIDRLMHEFRNQ